MGIAEQVAEIATMNPAALREHWERVQGVPRPTSFGPDLIARAMAYSLQEKAAAGLAGNIAREIRRGVAELGATSVLPDRPAPLRSGTRLTREWHGRTHHVHVVDGGFDYQDQRYRSLTAIAREITGARWLGLRFFGLAGSKGA
ncbi:MAG: DUF2924 domain-containing protein [Sphingomicrobium sp.]